MKRTKRLFVVAHNVRSVASVGSLFRTCDGVGAAKVFLTGYTPSPVDEMGRARNDFQKTALGADKNVVWEKQSSIARLRNEGISIVMLEQSKSAIDYRAFRPQFPLALVVGNEVRGLSEKLLKKADWFIQIPMFGKKESLNVAVAFGIAAYKLLE